MIWLKGASVNFVDLGRSLAVFYHEGNPLPDGTQKLGYGLYDSVSGVELTSGSVSVVGPRASDGVVARTDGGEWRNG